jgi:hypothetical protein
MFYKKGSISLFLVFISAVLLNGCASTAPVSDEDRSSLANLDKVRVMYYGNSYPSVHTAAGVLASEITIGMSTFGEDWTIGQKMMKKYNVPNPSRTMRDQFIRQVKSESGIKKFVGSNKPANYKSERKVEALQAKYKSGVVLQIMPGQFQIWYYPTNWARYHMRFTAWAQMVRLDDGKVLWKSSCSATQHNKNNKPSMDDLTADNSAVLKTWVDKATRQCSEQLAKSFLAKA